MIDEAKTIGKLVPMSEESRYNGWANYSTWCVNMWLSNDEGIYSETNALLGNEQSVYDAAEALKSFVEDLAEQVAPGVIEGASFVADLFGYAFQEADWYEIVTTWVFDLDGFTVVNNEIVEVAEVDA